MSRPQVPAALGVAAFAFGLYRATLLPGLDFGDTAFLQGMVGSPIITPRDGYPLFFAVGALFSSTGMEPAHALNLASAVEGALACGMVLLVASQLSGSVLAGLGSALLFAGSYTFWSQSIIAEVYSLHVLFVVLTLWLLLRWSVQPTTLRLISFFAAYALGFGNHLSTILLAPAYALFLLVSAPGGWLSLFTLRVWLAACACAAAGGMLYAWNLSALWLQPFPPDGVVDAMRTFWFDLTKADWRATLVFGLPHSLLQDRARMYLFDLHQQFGWPGIAAAAAGLLRIFAEWRRALLIVTVYLINVVFAFTYNVGDTHVFYLPSHLMVALLAASGIVLAGEAVRRLWTLAAASTSRVPSATAAISGAALLLILYGSGRIYRDYPALDRSRDHRAVNVLTALTEGLDDRRSIFLADLDWQVHNGLWYFTKEVRPEVVSARMPDLLLYAPALLHDNFEAGREILLTARARATLTATYGPLIQTFTDLRVPVPTISDLVEGLEPGTPYILCVLKPTREFSLDPDDLQRAASALTRGHLSSIPDDDYVAIAGLVGEPPAYVEGAGAPFRRRIQLAGLDVDVRMESWLAADTIRRMGFGQVVAARHHALIVERGVSFVALDRSGAPLRSGYASSIFAPQPRYLCYR
jgi:hypothetical protein